MAVAVAAAAAAAAAASYVRTYVRVNETDRLNYAVAADQRPALPTTVEPSRSHATRPRAHDREARTTINGPHGGSVCGRRVWSLARILVVVVVAAACGVVEVRGVRYQCIRKRLVSLPTAETRPTKTTSFNAKSQRSNREKNEPTFFSYLGSQDVVLSRSLVQREGVLVPRRPATNQTHIDCTVTNTHPKTNSDLPFQRLRMPFSTGRSRSCLGASELLLLRLLDLVKTTSTRNMHLSDVRLHPNPCLGVDVVEGCAGEGGHRLREPRPQERESQSGRLSAAPAPIPSPLTLQSRLLTSSPSFLFF
ncbi:hypothetical protein BKA62DRAFT_704430 [Auriculariales sp. MPI-PUGE-AT-0066]|nr:hypothetical protein BKA62DRAFT_704430 [Auriculariales sp. MPI-PUGE-AT-0066]